MKIAILTLPLHINYGGILQAWALQTVLKRMGHNVEVLMPTKTRQKVPWKVMFKRFGLICLGHKLNMPIFYELKALKLKSKVYEFTDKNIKTRKIKSFKEILPSDYDAIIIGSDQVWRKIYWLEGWKTNIENAFLDFTKDWNIKRIAYAASFGLSEWQFSGKETHLIKEGLLKFDCISVRENKGVELLQKNLEIEAIHTVDPTLLLSKEDYIALSNNKIENKKNVLVSYIFDPRPEFEAFVNKVAFQKGLERIELNKGSIYEKLCSLEDWISYFSIADFVITNSFHGCIFSLIFNKPFIFIENENRGTSRFDSLVKTFSLHNHRIKEFSNFDYSSDYKISKETIEAIKKSKKLSKDLLNAFLK